MGDDWRPACHLSVLRARAILLTAIREFFSQRNYLEVETPVLSHDIVVDAHLQPLVVPAADCSAGTAEPGPLFLQTSPEAGMKRLLAAGSGSIFQVTRSFRANEFGSRHNPEFTMVEWYGVDDSYLDQMRVTEALIGFAAAALLKSASAAGLTTEEAESLRSSVLLTENYARTRYRDAFLATVPIDPLEASDAELARHCSHLGLLNSPASRIERDDLLNLLLAAKVEPELGRHRAEFLLDYPLSQAALAQQNQDDGRTACRFELYAGGVELCNGYQELTDSAELARRDAEENRRRERHRSKPLPGAAYLQQAMQCGLPACSGVALGFDRLVMCLLGKTSLREVIPFPCDRA